VPKINGQIPGRSYALANNYHQDQTSYSSYQKAENQDIIPNFIENISL
jgi:hypothetical protein